MFTTTNLTNSEGISLSNEILLTGIKTTPFASLVLQNQDKNEKANGKIHTWRERSLDDTQDISAPEGSDTTVFYESPRAELNNVCEIFKKGVTTSGTVDAINVAGQGDIFASEVGDRLLEIKVNLENKLINGVRDDGSTSGVRKMDGILKFVHADNKVTGATIGEISEKEVKETVKKLWDQGLPSGQYFGLLNADLKEQIDSLYKDSYNYVAQENMFGLVVDVIRTNYGNLNLILSRHMPIDKMVVFDLNYVAIPFLREPRFELLAKTGDNTKGQVLSEATLKIASKKAVAEYTLKA